MIAVIFEVEPAKGRQQRYLALAAALNADLQAIDGFISVERFQSMADPAKMLSLSFFRDEEAVRRWRNTSAHRATQARGRAGVFADYRLRVPRSCAITRCTPASRPPPTAVPCTARRSAGRDIEPPASRRRRDFTDRRTAFITSYACARGMGLAEKRDARMVAGSCPVDADRRRSGGC